MNFVVNWKPKVQTLKLIATMTMCFENGTMTIINGYWKTRMRLRHTGRTEPDYSNVKAVVFKLERHKINRKVYVVA
jgi:hypothetical protein